MLAKSLWWLLSSKRLLHEIDVPLPILGSDGVAFVMQEVADAVLHFKRARRGPLQLRCVRIVRLHPAATAAQYSPSGSAFRS